MAKSGSCDLDICKGPGHIPWVQVYSVAIVPHRRWQVPPEELWCTCLAERHPLAVGSRKYLWRSGIRDEPGTSLGRNPCYARYKATREGDVSLLEVPETIADVFELKTKQYK